ncbi:signal peptidase II, peptidase A8 family [Tolypothrix sp. PCC 7601]|nr:signal peptidase II, peptidase A8 family [Tolypothrix sp. PCC 7601]BAY95245.1 hypothetical protein NIES3275_73020 [Microchaete diplosiphon NIES-3275]
MGIAQINVSLGEKLKYISLIMIINSFAKIIYARVMVKVACWVDIPSL